MAESPDHIRLRLPGPLMAVVRRWRALDPVGRGLIGFGLARWAIAAVFLLNVLPLELREGWFLYHQAGEEHIFSLAMSIAQGTPEQSVVGIGQPLVLLPWIWLLKPTEFADLIVPLVLINGFVLGGLSVIVIGRLAQRVTGRDRMALWAGGLWAVLPLLAYFAFFWYDVPAPAVVRSTAVPELGWLNGLTDGPATFFVMVAMLLIVTLYYSHHEDLRSGRARRWVHRGLAPLQGHLIAIGVCMGVAMMYRVHVAPMVGVMLAVVWWLYGWRSLLIVCAAGLIAYIPQMWYNQVIFRFPLTVGYISWEDAPEFGGFFQRPLSSRLEMLYVSGESLVYLWDLTIKRRPWLIIPLVFTVLLIVQVGVRLGHERGWAIPVLLIGGPVVYTGLMMTTWPFRMDVSRFLLPVFPYLLILCVYAAGQAIKGKTTTPLS